MSRRPRDLFQTIRTEGCLLPPELLKRIAEGDRELPGIAPADYHLEEGARLSEAVTRSWNRVRGAWESFRDARTKLAEAAPDAALTRDRWLLVLFQELGYGRLLAARGGLDVEGKSYPISHTWNHTPIHLIGFRTDLDKRTARVKGAATQSPHSLVQEFLNRSPGQLWGFVSNGLSLRLLRDNASLTRQAFVEFDLEAMMDGEVYADFALLWLVCHQSRVEAERPAECWLERWVEKARDQGTRALDRLRSGVETTIAALGRGFLAHPKNSELREALRSGALDKQDYYRELLRLVYRLLFLLVAEDRGLLLDPNAKPDAKSRYREHYSTERLRRLVARRRGGPHPDGWRALSIVMAKLGDDAGCPDLALPPLGSFLWSRAAVPHLADAELANEHLYEAVRALAFTESDRLLRPVDWRNLDSEELGSVYESLLELHPLVDAGAAHFELSSSAGHERKTTGSYYTPDSLVQCLLDTALDPVLDEACKKPNPEQALLDLKVCDPACGSGHFLIAAARRMARRLAQVRTGDAEPDPAAMQTALRDVIGRCLYGVDVNPMAVELCKVSLWLEAIEPGKPLSFLDHQIQCGNSLLGTTPALLAKGIPDDAFEPIEGDDNKLASALKKRNKAERRADAKQETMFATFVRDSSSSYGNLSTRAARLGVLNDDTIEALHDKEAAYRALDQSAEFQREKLLADAWCAAFVWPKHAGAPDPPTAEVFRRLNSDPKSVALPTRDGIQQLTRAYGFFHWHLAFSEVFRDPGNVAPDSEKMGWSGGFDVVLSNPPWDSIEFKEKEWFAERRPEIADAPNAAARKRLIVALEREDAAQFAAYRDAKREPDAIAFFASDSGRFPLCGRGRVNTYAVFAEAMRDGISMTGRVGVIVPSGIATDETKKLFIQDLSESKAIASLFQFLNKGFFPTVRDAQGNRFCLLTLTGVDAPVEHPDFVFSAWRLTDLDQESRHFSLSASDVALLNPNTRTLPVFQSLRDSEITIAIYRRVPVLRREDKGGEGLWEVSFKQGLFNMASDSERFVTREKLETEGAKLAGNIFRRGGERWLPLYESKMIHHFEHRFGDYALATITPGKEVRQLPQAQAEVLADPTYSVLPRYWVSAVDIDDCLAGRWLHGWLLGWRDVTSAVDVRTVITSILPRVGVGHTTPLMFPTTTDAVVVAALYASLCSFVFDYVARQKIGGTHLTYSCLNQLPVLPPATYESEAPWSRGTALCDWMRDRVLELTYTAWDLEPWAKDLGWDSPPFRWDESRRFLLRCELDAAFFHLYAINRDDTAYILDTFPIVRRKDEATHGEYRTKRVILEIYDEMSECSATSKHYASRLDPQPGDPCIAHERPTGKAQ